MSEKQMWRTPKSSPHGDASYNEEFAKNGKAFRKSGQPVELTLENQIRIREMFPTPTCSESEHSDAELTENGRRIAKNGGGTHSLNLADTVKKGLWRTPDCGERGGQPERYLEQMAKGNFRRPTTGTVIELTLADQARHSGLYPVQAKPEDGGTVMDGQLNPDWEEWLMDWVNGWTSLDPLPKKNFDKWEERLQDGSWNNTDPADLPTNDEEYIPRLTTVKTHKNDRIKAIGNGQVPLCVFFATKILAEVLEVFNDRQSKN